MNYFIEGFIKGLAMFISIPLGLILKMFEKKVVNTETIVVFELHPNNPNHVRTHEVKWNSESNEQVRVWLDTTKTIQDRIVELEDAPEAAPGWVRREPFQSKKGKGLLNHDGPKVFNQLVMNMFNDMQKNNDPNLVEFCQLYKSYVVRVDGTDKEYPVFNKKLQKVVNKEKLCA